MTLLGAIHGIRVDELNSHLGMRSCNGAAFPWLIGHLVDSRASTCFLEVPLIDVTDLRGRERAYRTINVRCIGGWCALWMLRW